jgi:hypothetical protein
MLSLAPEFRPKEKIPTLSFLVGLIFGILSCAIIYCRIYFFNIFTHRFIIHDKKCQHMEEEWDPSLELNQIELLKEILEETKKSSVSTDKINAIIVYLTIGGLIYVALSLLWQIYPLTDGTQKVLLCIGIGIVYCIIAYFTISKLRE